MVDENEFRRKRYEHEELRKVLPPELNKVMDDCFELLHPFVAYIHPVRYEVTIELQKLVKKQFPELNITGNAYLLQCIDDIINLVADMLASGLYNELRDIEAGVDSVEDKDQFQRFVNLYGRPHVPSLETLDDYNEFAGFTDDQKVEMINEHNEYAIAACNEFNNMKTEFMAVVQPILFKYFGERLDKLDSIGWERYAVEIGFSFYSYREDCYSLIYYLEKGLINGNPGTNFFEFRVQNHT
jgi:hypothetical protein